MYHTDLKDFLKGFSQGPVSLLYLDYTSPRYWMEDIDFTYNLMVTWQRLPTVLALTCPFRKAACSFPGDDFFVKTEKKNVVQTKSFKVTFDFGDHCAMLFKMMLVRPLWRIEHVANYIAKGKQTFMCCAMFSPRTFGTAEMDEFAEGLLNDLDSCLLSKADTGSERAVELTLKDLRGFKSDFQTIIRRFPYLHKAVAKYNQYTEHFDIMWSEAKRIMKENGTWLLPHSIWSSRTRTPAGQLVPSGWGFDPTAKIQTAAATCTETPSKRTIAPELTKFRDAGKRALAAAQEKATASDELTRFRQAGKRALAAATNERRNSSVDQPTTISPALTQIAPPVQPKRTPLALKIAAKKAAKAGISNKPQRTKSTKISKTQSNISSPATQRNLQVARKSLKQSVACLNPQITKDKSDTQVSGSSQPQHDIRSVATAWTQEEMECARQVADAYGERHSTSLRQVPQSRRPPMPSLRSQHPLPAALRTQRRKSPRSVFT